MARGSDEDEAPFGDADDWDLQRQKTNWTGSACGTTWSNDGSVVSGIEISTGIVRSQCLAV